MKKLIYLFVLLTSVVTVGCNASSDADDSVFSAVYPGMLLYSYASETQQFVMDGLATGARLVMILEEIGSTDISQADGLVSVEYNDEYYDLKEFLFGDEDNTSLSKSGDVYTISYGLGTLYSSGLLDTNYRRGDYTIATSGINFMQTTEANPWVLTTTNMSYLYSYDDNDYDDYDDAYATYVNTTTMTTKFWYGGSSNGYRISYDSSSTMAGPDTIEFDWQTCGTLDFMYGSPAFIDVFGTGSEVYLDVNESNGTTLTKSIDMTYETTTPLTFSPTESIYQVSGKEEIVASGVSSVIYPSSTVVVETKDSMFTYYYNDYILSFVEY